MPLTWTPSLKGVAVDSACKGAAALPPPAGGAFVCLQLLNLLYADIASTLAATLTAWLATATVSWIPPTPSPLTPPPIVLAPLPGLAAASAPKMDARIKSLCAGVLPPLAGAKAWQGRLEIVFADVATILPAAVATSLNAAVVMIPPGTIAPACVAGTTATAPALLMTPYAPTVFASALAGAGVSVAGAAANSVAVDALAKAACAGKGVGAGPFLWQAFLDWLAPFISAAVTAAGIAAVTTPNLNWAVPPGIPGLPLIPPTMVPTLTVGGIPLGTAALA